MLTFKSIIGNIFQDKDLMEKFRQMESEKRCEKIRISRHELERGRIRKTTDAGTDIGLVPNSVLHHGDVILSDKERLIVIEQLPEKVLSIKIESLRGNAHALLAIGHMVGNRHKPIAINDDVLSFPINSDSEADALEKLLSGVTSSLEFEVKEQIFQPQEGVYTHEH